MRRKLNLKSEVCGGVEIMDMSDCVLYHWSSKVPH